MKGAVLLLAIILLIVTLYLFHAQEIHDKKIDELIRTKQGIINVDSLRSLVEKKVTDSLMNEFTKRDQLIKNLQTDLTKTRKQNEKLFDLYKSIDVDMPKY